MKKSINALILLIILAFLFTACAKKEVKKQPVVPPKQEVAKPAPQPASQPAPQPIKIEHPVSMPMLHQVKKGECLWIIAGYKDIYNDPFMWPLIYKANKDKIKDPDLIYPGQMLDIDRAYTNSEKAEAIHFAKTRGKWSLFDGK